MKPASPHYMAQMFCYISGLSHEENLRKMRLLTFMQMAENKKDIDYDSIQKEMDISEDDVEDFIIDGKDLFDLTKLNKTENQII